LGRQLIEAVKTAAKKRGAKKMFWTVYALNRAARKFIGTSAPAILPICWNEIAYKIKKLKDNN